MQLPMILEVVRSVEPSTRPVSTRAQAFGFRHLTSRPRKLQWKLFLRENEAQAWANRKEQNPP